MDGIRWPKSQDSSTDAERSEEGCLFYMDGAVVIDLSGSKLTDCDLVEVVKEFSVVPETMLLRKNLLTDESAKVLSRTSVMHLDVGMNFVGEEGGRALAISSCCRKAKLRTLRLDSNSVEEAAVAFADALARTECTLEHLDLADNNVDDNGVVAIATALAGNTKLRVLDLSCNNLHSCGIVAISDALRDNKTLIILGLCETFLGNRGAEALASALQSNKSLASINLKDSGVTADGIAHLAEALKSNRTVSTLHLTDNGRDEAAEGYLRTCLEGNKTLCHIPGIYGLDDLLTRNMERQVSLAAFAREGDLESMRNLSEGGVGREVLLSSGLSIYHVCMDNKRSDMLDMLLVGAFGLGEGFFDTVGLSEGRGPACVEMRHFVQVRMVAFHCAWGRGAAGSGSLALLPREVMNMISRVAFESWSLPYC